MRQSAEVAGWLLSVAAEVTCQAASNANEQTLSEDTLWGLTEILHEAKRMISGDTHE